MKITFNNKEITKALIAYAAHKGLDTQDKEIKVDFINGRGSNGNSATIEIIDEETEELASSNEPDEEIADEASLFTNEPTDSLV